MYPDRLTRSIDLTGLHRSIDLTGIHRSIDLTGLMYAAWFAWVYNLAACLSHPSPISIQTFSHTPSWANSFLTHTLVASESSQWERAACGWRDKLPNPLMTAYSHCASSHVSILTLCILSCPHTHTVHTYTVHTYTEWAHISSTEILWRWSVCAICVSLHENLKLK